MNERVEIRLTPLLPPHSLRAALQRVLIAVTLQQTDAAKRADFVAILKKDGWL